MDEALEAAQKAAKNAKRSASLTLIAVAVAVLVLVIDQTIKRAVVTEAQKARGVLDEVRTLADGVRNGTKAAGEGGSPAGAGVGGGDDVVHDAPAGPLLDEAAGAAKPPPVVRKARAPRRAPGNE